MTRSTELLAFTVGQCSRQQFVSLLLDWGTAVIASLRKEQSSAQHELLWRALTAIFQRCAPHPAEPWHRAFFAVQH